jgi:hypothetical protein
VCKQAILRFKCIRVIPSFHDAIPFLQNEQHLIALTSYPNSTKGTSCQLVGQLLYNLLADILHRANLFANLLGVGYVVMLGSWQDQRPTSCTTCWALVLPEPNKFVGDVAQQVGQLVRVVEFGHKTVIL